jgi:hypothetical protein
LPELPDVGDHRIAGKATVPAVELLEFLVRAVAEHEGHAGRVTLPLAMAEVTFPKFLPFDEIDRCAFAITLEPSGAGVRATLGSRVELAGGMRRSRVHASATLGMTAPPPAQPPRLEFDFDLAAERIYRELITFGPRYRNLRDDVHLGRGGALGRVRSPQPARSPAPLGGCPYLLDAAMHLACVWGQRHAGVVAYPTGFASRVLVKPIPAGERRCVVVPRSVEPQRLLFDLWLTDDEGAICDALAGLAMSPLATGAPPPPWLIHPRARS